ncbi:hypothetical protein JQS43_17970 [Natronosporangium hydrolyticum]|uniref:Uncharacterized protein n=1 Tax=Natronosporangium hydrolyticum TaxID=2811111 RepID=A0A895YB56_9ACTN|nr:hypothetical protein [Natronosporangium hydrolyticum]QSB13472.1 hypothetical protein JQS43_17970 [Natronosporangium hydrolyticum]
MTDRAFGPANRHWEGMGAAELVSAPLPLKRRIQEASEALMWAALAVRYWAGRVEEFNRRVADLEGRWPGTEPGSWMVRTGPSWVPFDPNNATHAMELKRERERLQLEWRSDYQLYIDQGEDEAVAMLRRGPTAENLQLAREAGLIPATGVWGFFAARWDAIVAPEIAAELAAALADPTQVPTIEQVEEFAELLEHHADDPAFAAFLSTLTPAEFLQIRANLSVMTRDGRQLPAEQERWETALAKIQEGLGVALATATTHRGSYDQAGSYTPGPHELVSRDPVSVILMCR